MHIPFQHNRFVRGFINTFDPVVRLFYCKLKFYRLASLFFPDLYSSRFESLNSYFSIIYHALRKHGFVIKGKTILELGPGNSYINAFNFLNQGAEQVILVDKYPRICETEAQRQHIKKEIAFFKKITHSTPGSWIDERTCLPRGDRIRFIAGDFRDIPFTEGIDLIYSIAVLHHIKNLDRYIPRMHEILNPGGMMYHVIELKDKFHFYGNPFLFYKYSDWTWEHLLTDEAVTYTNRLRYQDYIDLFTQAGFEIVWQETQSYEVPRMRLNSKFSGRQDLGIGDLRILLKKKSKPKVKKSKRAKGGRAVR